jgi:hypothetical protein
MAVFSQGNGAAINPPLHSNREIALNLPQAAIPKINFKNLSCFRHHRK